MSQNLTQFRTVGINKEEKEVFWRADTFVYTSVTKSKGKYQGILKAWDKSCEIIK